MPGAGLHCTQGCPGGRWAGESVENMTDVVKKGRPVAQLYGIGAAWMQKYNLREICGEDSPVCCSVWLLLMFCVKRSCACLCMHMFVCVCVCMYLS